MANPEPAGIGIAALLLIGLGFVLAGCTSSATGTGLPEPVHFSNENFSVYFPPDWNQSMDGGSLVLTPPSGMPNLRILAMDDPDPEESFDAFIRFKEESYAKFTSAHIRSARVASDGNVTLSGLVGRRLAIDATYSDGTPMEIDQYYVRNSGKLFVITESYVKADPLDPSAPAVIHSFEAK